MADTMISDAMRGLENYQQTLFKLLEVNNENGSLVLEKILKNRLQKDRFDQI